MRVTTKLLAAAATVATIRDTSVLSASN